MRILLDTHILIHASFGLLNQSRTSLVESAENELFFSSFSLWEISKLFQLQRVSFERGLKTYLYELISHRSYRCIELTPEVLSLVPQVAEKMHKDPADQVIVCTALALDAQLMTDDRRIIRSKLLETV